MRISVSDLSRHPGLSKLQVSLDGEEVSNVCFEADEDEGYVKVYLTDEDAHRLRDPNNPNKVAWEKREGEVKIFLPPFK